MPTEVHVFDKLNKLQEKAQKATERYATTLASAAEKERKRRTGRLIKLGAAAVQMFEAGDLTLLDRFEQSITRGFGVRKIDRLDFGLDEDDNWFDRMRDEIRAKAASKPAVSPVSAADNAPGAKPRPAVAAVPPSVPRAPAQPGAVAAGGGGASASGSAAASSANA